MSCKHGSSPTLPIYTVMYKTHGQNGEKHTQQYGEGILMIQRITKKVDLSHRQFQKTVCTKAFKFFYLFFIYFESR